MGAVEDPNGASYLQVDGASKVSALMPCARNVNTEVSSSSKAPHSMGCRRPSIVGVRPSSGYELAVAVQSCSSTMLGPVPSRRASLHVGYEGMIVLCTRLSSLFCARLLHVIDSLLCFPPGPPIADVVHVRALRES